MKKHGVSQRLAQDLIRHSDPKLTANVYTDSSCLPTFEAINDLDWIAGSEDPKQDSQKSDFSGLLQSQTRRKNFNIKIIKYLDKEPLSRTLTTPELGRQKVLGTGIEPARPRTLEPKPSASANSATRALERLTKIRGMQMHTRQKTE